MGLTFKMRVICDMFLQEVVVGDMTVQAVRAGNDLFDRKWNATLFLNRTADDMQARYIAFPIALAMFLTACDNSSHSSSALSTAPPTQAVAVTTNATAPSVNAEAAAVVGQLSYCGASAVAQSAWNRQNGYSDVADMLERGAYAYGKTAVEYGQRNGYSETDVIALNRQNNDKLKNEIKAGFFFDGPSIRVKNENCLDLLKNTPGLTDIWRRHTN